MALGEVPSKKYVMKIQNLRVRGENSMPEKREGMGE